jgi:hypothetical protein
LAIASIQWSSRWRITWISWARLMRGGSASSASCGRADLDHLVIVARRVLRRAVEAFEPLGLGAADVEGRGDVVGDVGAPIGSEVSPTSSPPANSETLVTPAPISTSAMPISRSSSVRHEVPVAIGEATIDLTPRCAERTHRARLRTGDGSAATTWISTPSRSAWSPSGFLTPLQAVERVERRLGVEHHPAFGIERPAALLEQVVDILLLDLNPAEIDLDLGDVADEPARREADPDMVDIGAGDRLGLLDRLADRASVPPCRRYSRA